MIRQGERAGFFSRQACASSAVSGLNSGSVAASTALAVASPEPASEAEAILVISNGTQFKRASNLTKPLILYVKTRAFPFFDSIPCALHGLSAESTATIELFWLSSLGVTPL
jgi:hypothetical protein